MTITATFRSDKEGRFYLEDTASGYGKLFYGTESIAAFLKEEGGNAYEAALRESLRLIVAKHPDLLPPAKGEIRDAEESKVAAESVAIDRQEFTFSPAKAETTWAR